MAGRKARFLSLNPLCHSALVEASGAQLVRNEELGANMPVAELQKAVTVFEAVVASALPTTSALMADVQSPLVEVRAI